MNPKVRGNHPTRVRFPGICQAAKAIGVHRDTLYKVLSGKRTDMRGVKARYDEYIARNFKHAA